MKLKLNYKRSLTNFLGENNLPVEDMDMFCLLSGVRIARTMCKLVYSTVNVPFFCEGTLRYEEKKRLELYDECSMLVKGYIREFKLLNEKGYYNWYKEMQRIYETDKDFYSEKCKIEADKVMLVIHAHLMKMFL